MNKRNGLLTICFLIGALALYAQGNSRYAARRSATQKNTPASTSQKSAARNNAPVSVAEKPAEQQTAAAVADKEMTEEQKQQEAAGSEGFVTPREEVKEESTPAKPKRVVFNPKTTKDPTLSPDDVLLLEYREKQRLAALEAERKRKIEEERRRLEAEKRRRQAELDRIKDPTREVRNKFKIGGVIGQEVFIGDKIYTVGNTIFGARIVEVHADYVIFSYKGHRFRKNVQL